MKEEGRGWFGSPGCAFVVMAVGKEVAPVGLRWCGRQLGSCAFLVV